MKHVLVTGSKGQLGKCIEKASVNYPELTFAFHDSKSLDITHKGQIDTIFKASSFDYCINCAAFTNVEASETSSQQAYVVNAEAVKNLANACLENNAYLIHISTDYVFDGEKETPYLPEDNTNPINEYGKSKLAGELHIQEILQRYFIIRTSWLYSEFGNNFYKTILKKAKAGETLKITDEQTGRPTNANNLAKYILDLVSTNSNNFGIHHFTDNESMTWFDFAQNILRENNLFGKVKLERAKNYRTFANRPKNSILGNNGDIE